MLQKMRDRAQSTATKILLGLLIIVFTMFGFGAFEAFMSADPTAAKVNGVKISQNQLTMETDRQRQRILAQMGDGANPDLIDATKLRSSVLDGLINQTILISSAKDMGLRVSEADVDRVIVENPQFKVDGKFDADAYRRLLANAGHTPPTFKTELTNNFTMAQLTNAVRETPFVTEQEVRDTARLITQKRDIAYLVFAPEHYRDDVTVTDDQVDAYYQSHLPDFMTEDTVDVDYVRLSLNDLAKDPAFAPTEEQVVAQYEADVKAFQPQQRRDVAHILLQVNESRTADAAVAELAAIKQRLANGEQFEDIARTVSEDPGSANDGGDLGLISKGALPPEFEQVAWNLDVGAVSDPVRTEFGVHLIKVLSVEADEYPKLETVRSEIVNRLRTGSAEEQYRTKIRELDELAFESPDTLEHLADTSGLTVQHATGVTQAVGPAPFDESKLRAAAFGDEVLSKGFNSRVIELDKDAYVLRIKAHRPPVQRSLAEVGDAIRNQLRNEAATDLARQSASEALARVGQGEATADIADAYGLKWQLAEATSRVTPGVDGEIIRAAFELPRPTTDARSVKTAELTEGRTAVVTVSAVNDGDFAALSETERTAIRTQLARRVGNEEFTGYFLTLRDAASIDRI